jgi:hypothetical protein
MPLFTKVIGAGLAALLSIPVFGTSVIAANYSSPFLTHLADIVQGTNTSVDVSTNAPNWSYGVPLAQPILTGAATTTGGTMASSTQLYFAVAALDGQNGTTTVSNVLSQTTDASSTGQAGEGYEITWGAVTGATGYVVYYGSSPTALSNYFVATTTNAFTFSTTTSALAGSYTKLDTTAFSVFLNPLGTSFLHSGGLSINGIFAGASQALVGTSTAASSTAVEVNGNVRAQLAATSTNCYAATAGDIFYNSTNKRFWGCNGTTWDALDN